MKLSSIWRHPIKAIGREELDAAHLTPGAIVPGDRRWAVTHERTRDHGPGWAKKANFLRGVSGPSLMAVTAQCDGEQVRLSHPGRETITVNPVADAPALIDWLTPIWPGDLPRPTGVAEWATGMTDVPDPWISIHVDASHRAVAQKLGLDLSIHRWRGNLWVEGGEIWQEFEWVDRRFAIGDAVFEGRAPITRCKATMANPETGQRDADTLGALQEFGHQEMGLYAEVIEGGVIRPGDPVRLL